MKKSVRKQARAQVISQVDLLRMRVAAAESVWEEAKERAGQAKRRRKLAKLMAKRAQKDAKRAKANLAETRDALARAETVAITVRRRVVRRQSRGIRNRTSKKQPTAPARNRKSIRVVPSTLEESSADPLKVILSDHETESSRAPNIPEAPKDL